MDSRYIDTQAGLEQLAADLEGSAVLAVDTEFLREKTYYPKLCLIQLNNEEIQAIIDPLAVRSLEPLASIMANPSCVKIFHSGSQDIDILSMLCPHPEASYLIRVSGNSMIDAGVLSGDIVIVDKSNRNPGPHEIAMCELNGEYTLKHFILDEGQGWLVPANPEYPKIRITPDDDFSVWGTVTYIIHKARD